MLDIPRVAGGYRQVTRVAMSLAFQTDDLAAPFSDPAVAWALEAPVCLVKQRGRS
jgi:hypothetical protein